MRQLPILLAVMAGLVAEAAHGQAAGTTTTRPAARLLFPPGIDFPDIRGANYCSAENHHTAHWDHYDPKETDRDLDYAKRINISQVRVFLSYQSYLADKEKFRRNLAHLARSCQAHGIGLMPVVPTTREMLDEPAPYAMTRAWATDLLDTIGNEPALVMWDVFNEPDFPQPPQRDVRIAAARMRAELFRELDKRQPKTPITIGFTFERYMEQNADVVDVLAFHDYLPTRQQIHDNIATAKAFSAKINKPLINTEIGCTGRANPYDVCIQEYTNGQVGFYIWELMITGHWGNVHGVFYPDGTIRDPSIPAAMMGFFRNRSDQVVMELPDREGWVTRTVTQGKAWLAKGDSAIEEGLRIAEIAANLLEANQLIAMHDLPTRRVAMLREASGPDRPALRALLADLVSKLEPYQRPPTTQPR